LVVISEVFTVYLNLFVVGFGFFCCQSPSPPTGARHDSDAVAAPFQAASSAPPFVDLRAVDP